MSGTIIIIFCVLLLIAYVFDLTSSITKVPTVIFLLITGVIVRQITSFLNIDIPDLTEALAIFGTIGLILIVLEGSLELELRRRKSKMIITSFIGAVFALTVSVVVLGWLFSESTGTPLHKSMINAIPFCVISSAIAIPSVRNLKQGDKEFVIYESSLSDILGVLVFNLLAFNASLSSSSLGHFAVQLLVMIVVSFVATIGLSFLLSRIEHHIKFVPVILLVLLIYSIAKIFHLPSLIFILIFGLFIGNLEQLKKFSWINRFRPEQLKTEVKKFKELTIEATFLVRSIFFLLFGFMLDLSEILNPNTFLWAIGIIALIYGVRSVQLLLSGIPNRPLLFVAPRGLITILLFLSILPDQQIGMVNKSLIIQVIVLTALIMMFGMMITRRPEKDTNSDKLIAENRNGV